MRYTSNYNMTIAEGTDQVNLLTQSFPNFETIDTALKEVSDSAITSAAETKVGTAHNLVRTSPDRNIIKFTATSNFTTGDTFTVDGVAVTAVTTGGTTLKTGAFLINSNVLCILNGLVLTVLVSEVSVDASDVNFDNTGTSILSNNVQDAIEEVNSSIPSGFAATAITYNNSGSGLTATNTQDAIDELANRGAGITATTVWTNSNPAASFSAQNIPIDLTGYVLFEIGFKKQTTTGTVITQMLMMNGSERLSFMTFDSSSVISMATRVVTISSTGISFSDGTKSILGTTGGQTDNTWCIPTYVKAIK